MRRTCSTSSRPFCPASSGWRHSSEFVAAASRRSFGLIGTDFVEFLLLPRLLAAFEAEAPNLQVVFRPSNPLNIEAMMSAGELELAIGYLPNASPGLLKSVLFHEPFVCIARRGHPLLGKERLTLNRYIELPHIQALPRDGIMYASDIDSVLASMGLVRKIASGSRASLPSHRSSPKPT